MRGTTLWGVGDSVFVLFPGAGFNVVYFLTPYISSPVLLFAFLRPYNKLGFPI